MARRLPHSPARNGCTRNPNANLLQKKKMDITTITLTIPKPNTKKATLQKKAYKNRQNKNKHSNYKQKILI
jgi:hypothetical protein